MITIYHGDCLEEMKKIPDKSVDLILTDPPYGITACKWDAVIPFEPMWEQLKRVIKDGGAIVLTASQPFTSALVMSNPKCFRYSLVWDKRNTSGFLNANKMPLRRHEDILIFSLSKNGRYTYNPIMRKGVLREKGAGSGKKGVYRELKLYTNINDMYHPTSVLEIGTVHRSKSIHPTQKPVALMEYLIKTYTNEGETVLDFTMGSGTTGVACKRLNRNFIGIELDETYFNIAKERINNA